MKFALWGRSMGASLAIMYASYKPENIFSLVLDTPFRRLKKILENVAQHSKKGVPKIFINLALYMVEKKVEDIAKINVFNSDFLMHLNILVY